MKPQTIQIFLPEGSPTSVKEAELTNRLIKTIWFPRTAMDKAFKREIKSQDRHRVGIGEKSQDRHRLIKDSHQLRNINQLETFVFL